MKFIKENLRVVIAVIIAIILIVVGVILLNVGKEKESTSNPDVQEKTLEEQLKEVTGMSKEDAIELVKPNFISDNYEFTSEVTVDNFYKVIVTNIVDDSQIIYYVDPTNHKLYLDMDTD